MTQIVNCIRCNVPRERIIESEQKIGNMYCYDYRCNNCGSVCTICNSEKSYFVIDMGGVERKC